MSLKQYINEANIPYWEILVYYTKDKGFEEVSLVSTPKHMYKIMKFLKGIECEGFIRGHSEDGAVQSTIGELMSKWLYGARYNEIFKVRYRKYPGAKGWEWDWDHGLEKDDINERISGRTCKDYYIVYKNADYDEILEAFEWYLEKYAKYEILY